MVSVGSIGAPSPPALLYCASPMASPVASAPGVLAQATTPRIAQRSRADATGLAFLHINSPISFV